MNPRPSLAPDRRLNRFNQVIAGTEVTEQKSTRRGLRLGGDVAIATRASAVASAYRLEPRWLQRSSTIFVVL